MKKTSIIILLALAMGLMIFTVACEGESPSLPDTEASIPFDVADDTEDDVEAARGSETPRAFNFDNVTFDDWLRAAEPDDASYRGTVIDKDNLVSAAGN